MVKEQLKYKYILFDEKNQVCKDIIVLCNKHGLNNGGLVGNSDHPYYGFCGNNRLDCGSDYWSTTKSKRLAPFEFYDLIVKLYEESDVYELW